MGLDRILAVCSALFVADMSCSICNWLSGKPLSERSLEVLSVIRHTLPREYCVISVGGVFTGGDAQRLLEQGATLVQAYTGFVYRGPFFARKVLEEMGGSR